MRVDTLHRRIEKDVRVIHDAVRDLLPVQLPSQYESRAMNVRAFLDKLNQSTEPLGVFNELELDKTVPVGECDMTGLWLGKDELPENDSYADLRVIWHMHPDTKRFVLTPTSWNRRRFFWWEMTLHELVHRHQDVYRTPEQDIKVFRPRTTRRDIKEEQAYYGSYDEIEAHAHNAALEFVMWWPELSLRDAIRAAIAYTGRVLTPTYNLYEMTYCDTPKHPAKRTFKRKVQAWYDLMKKRPDIYQMLELPKLV